MNKTNPLVRKHLKSQQQVSDKLPNVKVVRSSSKVPPTAPPRSRNTPRVNVFSINDPPKSSNSVAAESTLTQNSLSVEEEAIALMEPAETSSEIATLWSCGQNIAGQLGLNHDVDITKYQRVKFPAQMKISIATGDCKIAAGAMTSYAIDVRGKLWSWGSNDEGALGRVSDDHANELSPQLVDIPEPVQSVYAGCTFAACITESRKLFIWGIWCEDGSDQSSTILQGSDQPSYKPMRILLPLPPKKVSQPQVSQVKVEMLAVGNSHILILDTHGRVFALGWNGMKQLSGKLPQAFITKPSDITKFIQGQRYSTTYKIVSVWAGSNSSWCKLKSIRGTEEKILGWGNNSHGQLGVGFISIDNSHHSQHFDMHSTSRNSSAYHLHCAHVHISSPNSRSAFVSEPKLVRVDRDIKIERIHSGLDFSLCLTKNAHVYTCGRGDYGQLGNIKISSQSKAACIRSKWVKVALPGKVKSIVACSRSAMCIDNTDKLIVWGDNYSHQLGVPIDSDNSKTSGLIYKPARVSFKTDNVKCVNVALGWGHSMILVQK